MHSGNTTRTAGWNSARTSGTSGQTCFRDTKALLPEWDNDDVKRLIHDLDQPRDAMETLAQVWQPDNTILVAPDWETIHR